MGWPAPAGWQDHQRVELDRLIRAYPALLELLES